MRKFLGSLVVSELLGHSHVSPAVSLGLGLGGEEGLDSRTLHFVVIELPKGAD
jgi:hypothetical protein